MSKSTKKEQTPLSPLDRVMERALLIEDMILSMDSYMDSPMIEELTPSEYEEFREEYRNLNDELDALYELSIELGYTSGYTLTQTY